MAAKKKTNTEQFNPQDQIRSYLDSHKDEHFNFDKETHYIVSSGSLLLDTEMSGGIRPGILRASGVSEGGKTSCALSFARNFQNTVENGMVVYIKSEGRLSAEMIERSGIDTDESKFGIHQWDNAASKWVYKTATVEINVDDGTDVGGDVHTPATGSSAATDGTFLVVVHVDNEASVTGARQMSIEYFYGVGGAWEILDSDGALSSGEAVTYDEHYSAPAGPSNNDIWVKTTRPGNGLALALNTYSGNSFVAATVQGISTTQADGAGAIGDFVAQDGSSVAVLTSSTAVVGNYVLDQQANTKATVSTHKE